VSFSAGPGDLLAFHDMRGGMTEADGAADAARRHRVIAGHHDHADAGGAAVMNRLRHVGARGVFQADDADEGQTLVGRGFGIAKRFRGAGDDAQAVMREFFDMGVPFGLHGAVERRLAVFHDGLVASRQHGFRRALDREQAAVAAAVHSRHHFAGGVEGVLVHERAVLQEGGTLEPGAHSCAQQRELHGIAAALFARAFEGGVIAQHGDLQKLRKLRVVAETGLLAGATVELDFAARYPQPPHGHAVFRQRAGLVGQDDRCGAQRFHCGEPFDQRVLPRHAPHAARERERRHDRQAFGDGRHGERDCRLDHQERILASDEADGADQRGQGQHRPDQLRGQARELLLQRRGAGRRLFH